MHEQFETILERVQLVNEERRKQIEKIGYWTSIPF